MEWNRKDLWIMRHVEDCSSTGAVPWTHSLQLHLHPLRHLLPFSFQSTLVSLLFSYLPSISLSSYIIAFTIFIIGCSVSSSCSSWFLSTKTACSVENCQSIFVFLSLSFFSFTLKLSNYLGTFLLAKFQIPLQAHLLLFSHKASPRRSKGLSS